MSGIFILGAKRTAIGSFGGALKNVNATALALESAKAAIESSGVSPSEIDSAIYGNVNQTSPDAIYLARHVALKAGCNIDVPGMQINRLCGSGFQSVVSAAHEIKLGESNIVLAGGTENMSQSPFATYNSRFGIPLGTDPKYVDTLWSGLTDSHIGLPMGMTAENLAVKYNISRLECDEYAVRSQKLFKEAQDNGTLAKEIAPMQIKGRKGMVTFEVDEHPKPTTVESIAKLKPVFKKDGVVTAAHASGICDGAASLIVASEEASKKYNPLARIVSWHVAGVDPAYMGIGPVPACQGALKKAGLTLDQIDLIDVNEAFAPQFLAVAKEMNFDMDKTNTCGGAIAVGHPLGASGSRILAHLTHALHTNNKRYAMGSACIGGGQGIAVILERV